VIDRRLALACHNASLVRLSRGAAEKQSERATAPFPRASAVRLDDRAADRRREREDVCRSTAGAK
jgi:hypothetical protein